MVNEIGATEGRQVVTSDGAHAQVIVIDGNAYIYGDVKAVTNYFALTSTDPQQYADKWLELTPSNPGFTTVSAAVTLASDFGHVALPGHLTEGRVVTIDGHKVQPISAHILATSQSPAGTATLYVTTTGRILPFEYRAVAKGVETTTKWSNWGHSVSLAVPSPSIPLGQ
jgi:hypothetical protein